MDTDVVVLGAGAAGLAAARALTDAGHQVVVLEARDLPGGRIRTVHVPGLPTALELGAEFVHGRAPATRKWLMKAGCTFEHEELQTRQDGWEEPEPAPESQWEELAEVMIGLDPGEGEDESVESAFLRAVGRPELLATVRSYLVGYHAIDPERASARALAREEANNRGPGPTVRIPEGQDRIVAGLLLGGAPLDVRTRTVVERVEHGGERVAVTARDPLGREVQLIARYAVVALPIGVLESGAVDFDPPLPAVLGAVAPGAAIRVALCFDPAFWAEGVPDFYFLFGHGPFPTFWAAPRDAPAVVAWCGGGPARHLSALPELERVERAVASFASAAEVSEAFVIDHLRGWHHHDWLEDPFSRGAYSYVTVGGYERLGDLCAPRGRLVLAGEHICVEGTVSSTVEAALQSGERAAGLVGAALGRP